MTILNLFPQEGAGDEDRLAELDLYSSDFQTAFRPGLARAINRSELAPPNAAGTDLYNDTFELLAQILVARGWRKAVVMGQPRLLNPDGKCQLALSSAEHVSDPDPRVSPKTRRKGPATQHSLDNDRPKSQLPLPLPEWVENDDELPQKLKEAPLWFVLYGRKPRSNFLQLGLGRPARMDVSDRVVEWSDLINMTGLEGVGDLSAFDLDDDGDIDVPVEPRD
ncbi:hypothetical protein [Microbacterium oxydans]|uniref:hypothetical protein n=1 Tax=Microbacterium oxydans TaxID=82380 RepID=UPI0036729F21